MNARTFDHRNSWLTSELPILSTFKYIVTKLKCVRCRNSQRMSELPTVGTPDLRRNSRPSWHLKTCRWPLVVHTGHVRYDQDSEPSKSVKRETSKLPTYAGTPDRWNFWLMSELLMNQPKKHKNFIVAWHIPDTSSINTARPAKHKLALLSLKHSKLTWVGLSTYKTLSINMMHPS